MPYDDQINEFQQYNQLALESGNLSINLDNQMESQEDVQDYDGIISNDHS